MAKLTIDLDFESGLDADTAKKLVSGNRQGRINTIKLANFLKACAGGLRKASYTLYHNASNAWTVTCDASALQDGTTTLVFTGKDVTLTAEAEPTHATGTITCTQASVVATTDKVTIDSVDYTSVAADPDVTEGEWLAGADDDECAANLAAAINGHTSGAAVTATVVDNVVTVTANAVGTAGNFTFTETGNGLEVSGAGTMTGGVNALDAGEFAIVLSGASDALDDTGSATSLKAAIEASTVAPFVTVTQSANVLTITANDSGPTAALLAPTKTGNGLTIAAVSAGDLGYSTESYEY